MKRKAAKPLICWWARQDSNLQPDRYERSEHPENLSFFNEAHALSCAFMLICLRSFCGISGGQFCSPGRLQLYEYVGFLVKPEVVGHPPKRRE
jgi:hypothetical protein